MRWGYGNERRTEVTGFENPHSPAAPKGGTLAGAEKVPRQGRTPVWKPTGSNRGPKARKPTNTVKLHTKGTTELSRALFLHVLRLFALPSLPVPSPLFVPLHHVLLLFVRRPPIAPASLSSLTLSSSPRLLLCSLSPCLFILSVSPSLPPFSSLHSSSPSSPFFPSCCRPSSRSSVPLSSSSLALLRSSLPLVLSPSLFRSLFSCSCRIVHYSLVDPSCWSLVVSCSWHVSL